MSTAEHSPAFLRRSQISRLLLTALVTAGFGVTVAVFFPGALTEDARYIYEDITRGFLGDWQSPVMAVLWSVIDPIAPGTASMFLLTAATYWLAFAVLAFTLAQRSFARALAVLLLALSPPAWFFLSMIWRDVLFASTWLLAAVLCFHPGGRVGWRRTFTRAIALSLLAFGVLLRPNALLAAPVLGAYLIWPAGFSPKRAAILFLPAALALFALVQVIYYAVLGAERQNVAHAIVVFDLGGITHFTRENQFPISWTASETTLLTDECYRPNDWGVYWNYDPCTFVMRRLEQDKLFGSREMVQAWAGAVWKHPAAYLHHRFAFMWTFLAGENSTLWTGDAEDPTKAAFGDSGTFAMLRAVHDALKATPLFRPLSWLLASLAIVAIAWPRRRTPSRAFAVGVCGSAAVYVLSFLPVGVAADFRYVHWAVLASIAGFVVILPCATMIQISRRALGRH
jgi:hypothetical protein